MTDHPHPDAIAANLPAAGEDLDDPLELDASNDSLDAWERMQEASSQFLAHSKRRSRRPPIER